MKIVYCIYSVICCKHVHAVTSKNKLHTHDRTNVLILKSAKFSMPAGVTVMSPYCLQSSSGQYHSHLRWHRTTVQWHLQTDDVIKVTQKITQSIHSKL